MRYVLVWIDGHGSLGCGYRRTLVLSAGRKWVKLYEPSTCRTQRLLNEDFNKALIHDLVPSRKLKSIIRNRAKSIGDTSKQTKRILKAL